MEKENSEKYVDKIINRIKNILTSNNISQKEFAERCGLSPSALSKLLKGTSVFSLKMAYKICEVLKIQPQELLSAHDNTLDNLDALSQRLRSQLEENDMTKYQDSLLFDPNRPAFRGIINDSWDENDVFYFYTKPTISSEKKGFLKGELRIIPSNTIPAYCSATLKLKTGKRDRNQQEIIKIYTGEMIISLPMGSCYILLTSPKYAEVNLISFAHMFLNNQKLVCRIAACLTTSAGANRRPVLSKAIISRVELSDRDLDILEGQLFMNTSRISVMQDRLDGHPQKDKIKKQLEILKCSKPTCYYEIDEIQIRSSSEFTAEEKMNLTNLLRKLSENPRYVKVSGKADELLFSYIENLYIGGSDN